MGVRTTNYTGRQTDISIFRFADDSVLSGPITLAFGTPQKIITGIEALKQVFVITLFTETGSTLLEAARGTLFGNAVGQSNISQGDLQHVANIAVSEATTQIIEDQLTSTQDIQDDEYLVDASVVDILQNTDTTQIGIVVELTTRAGTDFDLFIPLEIAIT